VSPLDISSSPNQRWLAKEFANSIVQTHRSTRVDVHGYVEFAKHLAETEGPEPDPDFRAALRHRLLHELIEDELLPRQDELAMRRDQRGRRKGGSHCFERAPREPWIAAASTVLVVCGGAIGLGQDSSQALPGDALYPVKRFFESGEMAIAGSSSDQARELMEQASERLEEARQLVTMDDLHARQALPATIVDFNEAATEAGAVVIEHGQADGDDVAATLVSEFRAFSSTAHTMLDEIAADADDETAALIDDARSTLDGIEEQLPLLDQILGVAENTPVASDGIDLLGVGGQGDGSAVVESSIDEAAGGALPVAEEPDSNEGAVDEVSDSVTGSLEGTTDTLQHTVSVVELATSDTVSMAVATVNKTARAVDQTVRQTLDTARETVERTAETVNRTVEQTVETAEQTVEQTVQTVEQTAATLDQTVTQATESLQQTAGALQTALEDAQPEVDDLGTGDVLPGQLTS
jgi:hypothetical protein